MGSVLAGSIIGLLACGAIFVAMRHRARPRRRRVTTARSAPTVAVHMPADDPHWLEYAARQAKKPAKKPSKVWAAGLAGSIGTGTGVGGCGAGCGGAGCGGGGCGGGGCGGGS